MTRVVDPETNKEVIVWPTKAYSEDLQRYSRDVCAHSTTTMVMRTVRGGAKQYVGQCLTCGQQLGSAHSQKDITREPPPWDDELSLTYERARKRELENINLKHLAIQKRKSGRFSQRYADHLKSEKWLKARVKIFRRANNICEACLEAPAREVHHLTYENLCNEFMYELVAVCRPCHERITEASRHSSDGDNLEDEVDSMSVEAPTQALSSIANEEYEGDWLPCHGCTFQSGDEYGTVICGVFDIPSEIAIADEKLCGPKKISFRALG